MSSKMPTLLIREDGKQEWVCEHGVGHTSLEWIRKQPKERQGGLGVHGCDGCCRLWDEA